MICTRCRGCLLREHLYRQGPWWWRCFNCGDRVDRTILFNRAEHALAVAEQHEAMERDCQEWAAWMAKIPVVAT